MTSPEPAASEGGFSTLPDLLGPDLLLVFVGINPSIYSVERGHYFARPTNRFWPAFSASRLSAPIRQALGVVVLPPEVDILLPGFGIGFTDVVKIPTSNAAQIPAGAFQTWTPRLAQRLESSRPRLACFHGVTGYRPFLRFGLGIDRKDISLGLQPETLGPIHLYVVPNPSPANAHFTLVDQTAWYDRLADYLDRL